VLGLRDVLDGTEGVQRDWHRGGGPAFAEELYDQVWLYSDENLCPTADLCEFSDGLRQKSVYTGYVVTRSLRRGEEPSARPTIVGAVGGGRDGYPALAALLRAAQDLRERHPKLRLRLFSGPLMPEEEVRQLRGQVASLGGWVKMEAFSSRYLRVLRDATAVVTMGGYNSTLECMALAKPTLVVPREKVRCEQLIRAEMFAERGALQIIRRGDLAGTAMRDRLAEILAGDWKPTPMRELNFHGYRTIIHQISDMLKISSSEVTPCAFLQ
jgi:predicted glycosyltransferase